MLRRYSFSYQGYVCRSTKTLASVGDFSLPIANCAAGLYFQKFVLVLGVCQPTKVRR